MATVSNLHWVDYVVIVGYFALVIAVGIISSIKVFIIFIVMLILNFQRFSTPSYHIFVISITPNHFEAEKLYNKKCKSNLATKQSQAIFSVFGVWYRIVYLVFCVCQLLLWCLSTWSFPVIPIFLMDQSKRDSVAGYFLASRKMHWIPVTFEWSWKSVKKLNVYQYSGWGFPLCFQHWFWPFHRWQNSIIHWKLKELWAIKISCISFQEYIENVIQFAIYFIDF